MDPGLIKFLWRFDPEDTRTPSRVSNLIKNIYHWSTLPACAFDNWKWNSLYNFCHQVHGLTFSFTFFSNFTVQLDWVIFKSWPKTQYCQRGIEFEFKYGTEICISFLKMGVIKHLKMHRPILNLDLFFVICLYYSITKSKTISNKTCKCTNLIHNSI